MSGFAHLHNHTQFSLLDGFSDISKLYSKAIEDGMPALAITDHGNMFGVFKFVAEASSRKAKGASIKPIVGCEFYMVENRFKKQFTKQNRDIRYHQLMLAKNATGYQNLCKLSSLAYIDGFYSKYPRIDKELITQHHEGLIASSCCMGAIIPKMILEGRLDEAENELKWWLEIFGEDFYIELQRHGLKGQEELNQHLLFLAKKYNVKVIATNDSHYVDRDEANTHDILLCINTGELQSTPIMDDFGSDESDQRGKRFGFKNDEFYFKNSAEMAALFHDVPQAIENTLEIVEKVEHLELKKDILLPHFSVPPPFTSQDEYLRHITMEGAKNRYIDLTPEITERINFELSVISTMGFAGYFLIVADFIKAGREMGVVIGPGRGSAAGSVVAFAIGVTNIDPIKYNLLFERFLNPSRKSLPDIDTDFDDEGRQKVIDYVIEKYGKNQVAKIITYGTIAAKSSIKDVSRVLDFPLNEANELVKLVPDKPGISLNAILTADLTSKKDPEAMANVLKEDDLQKIERLQKIFNNPLDPRQKILSEAIKLEGSIRNVGVHAAGVIIAPTSLMDILPVATAKDSDLVVTQYEGKVVEDAGVIKMDFLGLRTLSIIKGCIDLIRQNHGIELNIDHIPLDDTASYELFQRGDTFGTFQFESPGMTKYLRELKPDKLEDLIMMNALYRPGPISHIPPFIKRKHGEEEITYPLKEMEDILRETYGIPVYQEQVMQLSQKLANLSLADADILRKAMGKKDKRTLDSMYQKFIEGCRSNNLDEAICNEVWKNWEAFASYAFNKSHSTCYAYLAYQTAYLKAHYLPEFMAANLQHQSNIEKITAYMQHCKVQGLKVLGPDVNESHENFGVSKSGTIRFGLSSIKGIGGGPANDILMARKEGEFTDVYDFVVRVPVQSVNKKTLEALALSGAFDQFGIPREAYLALNEKGSPFIEQLTKYASSVRDHKGGNMMSLFGDDHASVIPKPPVPVEYYMSKKELLDKEKELIGIYASGHPLDDYRLELQLLCNQEIALMEQIITEKSSIQIGGMITKAVHGTTKRGDPFCKLELTDFSGSYEFFVSKEMYYKYKELLHVDVKIFVEGEMSKRWKSEYVSFNPKKMKLLSNMSEEHFKGILLKIPQDKVSSDIIHYLQKFIEEFQGNQSLKIAIVDQGEKFQLMTNSSHHLLINQLLIEWAVNNQIEFEVELN